MMSVSPWSYDTNRATSTQSVSPSNQSSHSWNRNSKVTRNRRDANVRKPVGKLPKPPDSVVRLNGSTVAFSTLTAPSNLAVPVVVGNSPEQQMIGFNTPRMVATMADNFTVNGIQAACSNGHNDPMKQDVSGRTFPCSPPIPILVGFEVVSKAPIWFTESLCQSPSSDLSQRKTLTPDFSNDLRFAHASRYSTSTMWGNR
jgi:hypothetical protein